jgi:hypothetical protein
MSKLRAEFDKPIVRYGLLTVAVIVAIQQLVLPWFDWRASKVAELRQARSLLVSEDAVIAATARLEIAKQELSAALGEVQPRFQDPSTNQKVDFPAAARALFEASGLTVNSVSAEEVATDLGGLKSFVVRLELEGSISDMLAAVQAVETGERYTSIDRLTVFDVKPNRVQITAELRRYVRKTEL